MTFSFTYGPRMLSGAGVAGRIAESLPDGPALFVTDGNVLKLGLAEDALASLASSQRMLGPQGRPTPRASLAEVPACAGTTVIFDQVEADPSRATLEAAVALGRDEGVTSVVGFGGGSPMDVAKLAAYLLGSGDDLDAIWGVGKATGKRLPLILVPTTAGTGSEATPVSIITDGHEKKGVSSPSLVADIALLDPALTLGLPRGVTAATGIDAMVHAIEAFTSTRLKNPLSDMLAKEALRLLGANIRTACDDPSNIDARAAMLLGAHLAGVAFANAPVGGVHALAYPLGARFGVAHGLSNALMLPHVLSHNLHAAQPLYAELGLLLDPTLASQGEQGGARGLIDAMNAIAAHAGVPRTLREVGVTAADLDTLAADAMRQERLLVNNPSEISEGDARRIYEAAF